MRVPDAVHASRPWRIHEVLEGFRLEDAWELPVVIGPDDFDRVVREMAAMDPSREAPLAVRLLFAARWRLGDLLGWDEVDDSTRAERRALRDRLPADLRDGPSGPEFEALPFTSLYQTEDEWAAETANRTMHGVLHLGRVPDATGGYRIEMAVYVRPHGVLGGAYMAAIRPFRHRIVYPAMLREMGRRWSPDSHRATTQGTRR